MDTAHTMIDENTPAPEVKWSDRISVGNQTIDDQHKQLISIANKLIRAMHNGLAPRLISSVVKDLREYTVYHFGEEEGYMRAMGYPHLADHQREHSALTQKVKEFQDGLYRKQDIKPTDIRDFIRDWLVNHILRTDGRFASYMREKGVDEPPRPSTEPPQAQEDSPSAEAVEAQSEQADAPREESS